MADDTTSSTTDATQSTDASTSDQTSDGAGSTTAGTFDQAAVDRIVRQRLARAEKDWAAKADEAKRQATMTETEKLTAQVAAANQKAQDAESRAAQRLVQAEARVQAATLGVKPERIGAVLKLTDLSGVTLGEDGEPNAGELSAAIAGVLKDFPEFKAGAPANVGGGSNPAAGTGQGAAAAPDMAAAIKTGNPALINAAFEAARAASVRGR